MNSMVTLFSAISGILNRVLARSSCLLPCATSIKSTLEPSGFSITWTDEAFLPHTCSTCFLSEVKAFLEFAIVLVSPSSESKVIEPVVTLGFAFDSTFLLAVVAGTVLFLPFETVEA